MGDDIQKDILQKLFGSFNELESAISGARDSLQGRESVPNHIFERLDSYDSILEQQREMAFELCRHLDMGNMDEVAMIVKKINGLSQLIRDDARDTLSLINPANNSNDVNLTDSETKKDILVC